ncbi:uncharacterized protein LOC107981634 [Nasonia vitripennis]|uniref:DNA-directed DNA polymerase n=1 Tax=Nasonia vitripennis TaxID=7425 RepID=A0A7M7TBG4_NASVI|nr:uncharacterized protein LOC107981634 [Nasonia vitripennis]
MSIEKIHYKNNSSSNNNKYKFIKTQEENKGDLSHEKFTQSWSIISSSVIEKLIEKIEESVKRLQQQNNNILNELIKMNKHLESFLQLSITQQPKKQQKGKKRKSAESKPKNCKKTKKDEGRIKSMMHSNDKAFKINTVLSCKFTKTCVENNEKVEEKEGEYMETKYFNTKNHEILSTTLLNKWFKSNVIEPLLTDIEEFQERDSGWTLHSIENIQININKFNPMRAGSSYIPLPAFIEKRKACINVKNYDNKCFIWAILSALYPVKHANHSNRLNNYIQYENILNMEGIELPVLLKSIPRFEKQNNAISINVFGLDNKDITPLYLTSCKKSNHINLLLLTNDNLDGGDVDKSDEGPEASKWFAGQLRNIEKQISDLYANPLPMPVLSQTELIGYYDSKTCHICKKLLNDDAKVRDHCHLTGKYRGPAHATCNLNYQDSKIVPVVFHNLSGYDAHFIITDVSNHFPGQIDLLPLTKEKYISFTKHVENSKIKIRFLDSFRIMPTSLEKLASYLQDYSIVNKEFSDLSTTQINLLTRKGVLPYEYISSWEKLEECKLSEKEDFFSILNDSSISDRDYEHAQNVWSTINIQTLGEYSDLYMKTDVLLLADVFENFRDQSMNVYNLDPAHYYTTPGFSWDAMLKHTGVQLKLLTDIDMVLFIERGIRGGLSQCSNRYAAANHKYMLEKYDKNKCLPYDEFQWLENCESFELFSIASDASHGYILEVDLDYPPEIHDDPFCPEHAKPPGSKLEKLLATLQPKRNYVIHYIALQQALSNGLRLVKIHKILKFKQSPWLKSYIDLNTSMRAVAKNEFEKNFFKLMNNAVFGKTMENIRKRVTVKLMSKYDGRYGVEAQISKPNFHSSSIFNENLVAIQLNKTDDDDD